MSQEKILDQQDQIDHDHKDNREDLIKSGHVDWWQIFNPVKAEDSRNTGHISRFFDRVRQRLFNHDKCQDLPRNSNKSVNPEHVDYLLENEAAYIRAMISWYDAGEYKKYKAKSTEKYSVPDTEELLSEDENFKDVTMEELESIFDEIEEYSLSEEVESHWNHILELRAKYDLQDHQMNVLSESYNKAHRMNKRYTGDNFGKSKIAYEHEETEYIDNAYLAIADNMYDKEEFISDLENRFLDRVIKSFKERVIEKYIYKMEREGLGLTDQDKKAIQRKITTEICIQLINELYGSNKPHEPGSVNEELFSILKEECCPDKDAWYNIQDNAIRIVYLESFERSVVRLMRRDLAKTRYKYIKEKKQTDSYTETNQQEDKSDKQVVGTKPQKRAKKIDESCSLYEIYISKSDPLVVAYVDKILDKVSKAARNEKSAEMNRAIILGRMKGLQFSEIAKELNTTKSNISKRVQMLKKVLDDELGKYSIKID